MAEHGNDKKFPFSPTDGADLSSAQEKVNGRSNAEQDVYIRELQRVNEELRQARRAALNLMEDAILSKEASRQEREGQRKGGNRFLQCD